MKVIAIVLTFSLLMISCGPNRMSYHVAGSGYRDSVNAALILATRDDPSTGNYDGVGYGDSRAASEDAHYHGNPEQYEGRSLEDCPRGNDKEN